MVYESLALFAYYEAVPKKPTLEELEIMNNETFIPRMEKLKFLNMNLKVVMNLEYKVYYSIFKGIKKHEEEWPNNYDMEIEPYKKDVGIKYKFTRCPIAEFAKAHGYLDLMPAFCNPDYKMLEVMHGNLIRTTTCANGDFCDYFIVGSKSKYLMEHNRKTKNGYICNE